MGVRESGWAWLAVAVLVGLPVSGWAHACGGPDHLWRARSGVLSADQREVLASLVLGPETGMLLSNSPGDDAVEVNRPVLNLGRLQFQSEWGRFEFVLPQRMAEHETDISSLGQPRSLSDSLPDPFVENEAIILREWAWQGPVTVPPRFLAAMREAGDKPKGPVQATLVLQGVGSGCTQATDFTKWVLWIGRHRVAGTVKVRPQVRMSLSMP